MARLGDESFPAAVSIGTNPTIPGAKYSVEVHLISFDADLYGQSLEIEFVRWLRQEQKFASERELASQIGKDVQQTLAILEEYALLNKA